MGRSSEEATKEAAREARRIVTFVVGDEEFVLPRPFLAIHSPLLALRMREAEEAREAAESERLYRVRVAASVTRGASEEDRAKLAKLQATARGYLVRKRMAEQRIGNQGRSGSRDAARPALRAAVGLPDAALALRAVTNDKGPLRFELPGDSASFAAFTRYLTGEDALSAANYMSLLHWAKELEIEYVMPLCEDFLVTNGLPQTSNRSSGAISARGCSEHDGAPGGRLGLEPLALVELAARYNMPLLYARASEVAAHEMHYIDLPSHVSPPHGSVVGHTLPPLVDPPLPAAFGSEHIREDLVRAHVSMGLMRGDGEMRMRHRFADYTALRGPEQRSRLLWKSRHRFVKPCDDLPQQDWKSLQTVWPHHSLRGNDWAVVPSETQPTQPLRARGVASASAARGVGKSRR